MGAATGAEITWSDENAELETVGWKSTEGTGIVEDIGAGASALVEVTDEDGIEEAGAEGSATTGAWDTDCG